MPRVLKIFDTTLRDGEQAPGCSMNLGEKLKVAEQLERLGVDVIEAGFPIASPGDLASVREIARRVRGCAVAGLARAVEQDIDAAWEALRPAEHPRIHTFLATSPVHMEYKLRMSPDEVVRQTAAMVRYARKLCPDVEFSAEDASRSDPDFLCRVFQAAIEAGATTVNLPDTVGYALPGEFAELVRRVKAGIPDMDKAAFSVHCHDDLGLAVANSLAAVAAGADQVECTVNGIGERAGNASLEEIAMILRTRVDALDVRCGVDTTQIYAASRLVTLVTGSRVQANKAIVGENAFAHESGIHQHGVLARPDTYEIMTPESVGLPRNKMVLGKHSGRHAFEERLSELGIHPGTARTAELFRAFKDLADKKKAVSDRDIEALARGWGPERKAVWKLGRFIINSGSTITSTSAVSLVSQDGRTEERVATGDGPIDASFKAIDKIVGRASVLEDFSLDSVTGGKDAQGEAHVRVRLDDRAYNGHGVSTDVIEASVKAYIDAINAMAEDLEAEDAGTGADATEGEADEAAVARNAS